MDVHRDNICSLGKETVRLLKSTQVISSVYSAIKELTENAVDAGATLVSIKLEDFGLQRIELKDNGSGITDDNISLVCQPHTTSKIKTFADLESLVSFGFRGEALSSLCQVGTVSITSKHKLSKLGHTCTFGPDGKLVEKKVVACNVGTIVDVKKLFEKIPVRKQYHSNKKFKREQLKKIEELMMAYALAYPNLNISLANDRCVLFQRSPMKDINQALHSVFPNTASKFIHKSASKNATEISLHILGPDHVSLGRSTHNHMFLIVNNRPVVQKNILKVLKLFFSSKQEGCHGKYPIGLLQITTPPHLLDVNLEPNKDRVLFREQEELLSMLRGILQKIYGCLPSAEITCTLSDSSQNESVSEETSVNEESFDSLPMTGRSKAICSKSNGVHSSINKENIVGVSRGCSFSTNSKENLNEKPSQFISSTPQQNSCGRDNLFDSLSTINEQPSVLGEEERAPPSEERATPAGKRAPAGERVPSAGERVPSAGERVPSAGERVPSAGERVPSAGERVPSAGERVPSAGERVPSAGERVPSAGERVPSAGENSVLSMPVTDPLAWSKGLLTNRQGTNIQTVSIGKHRLPSDEETTCESPAKRQRTEVDNLLVSTFVPHSIVEKDKDFDIKEENFNNGRNVLDKFSCMGREKEVNQPQTISVVNNDTHSTVHDESIPKDISGDPDSTKDSRGDPENSLTSDRTVNRTLDLQPPPLSKSKKLKKESHGDKTAKKIVLCDPGLDKKHGSFVRKPSSALAFFARDVRNEVLRELPGADFSEVGREINRKWKTAERKTIEEYENKAEMDMKRYQEEIRKNRRQSSSSGDQSLMDSFIEQQSSFLTDSSPREATLTVTVTDIRQSIPKNITPSTKVPTDKIIGKVLNRSNDNDCGGIFCFILLRDDILYGIRTFALLEMVLFFKLMESYEVHTKKLIDPVPFNQSSLGEAHWSTLLSLSMQHHTNYSTVTDCRVTQSGFGVALFKGANDSFSHGEITNLADNIGFYGMNDFLETLSLVAKCHHNNNSLSYLRPVKLKHFIQGECVRMTRAGPNITSSDTIMEKLSQWETYKCSYSLLVPDVEQCLHGDNVLHRLYDMENLSPTQSSTQSFILDI